jgi:hypothetical protein
MDKQMNTKLRALLILASTVAGGFYVESSYGHMESGKEGDTMIIIILCFILGMLIRTFLLRNKYANIDDIKLPNLHGAVWGKRVPLQTEVDTVLISFSAGTGALVFGLLLKRGLSVGGVLLIAWCFGDFFAIHAFLKSKAR